eukprot:5897507-Amphidinium_carterae.1
MDTVYLTVGLGSGLAMFESYTSAIAVSDFFRAAECFQGGALLESMSIHRARFIIGPDDSHGGEEYRACSRRPNIAASRADMDRSMTCCRQAGPPLPVIQTLETRRAKKSIENVIHLQCHHSALSLHKMLQWDGADSHLAVQGNANLCEIAGFAERIIKAKRQFHISAVDDEGLLWLVVPPSVSRSHLAASIIAANPQPQVPLTWGDLDEYKVQISNLPAPERARPAVHTEYTETAAAAKPKAQARAQSAEDDAFMTSLPTPPAGHEFSPLLDQDHLDAVCGLYKDLTDKFSVFQYIDDGYELFISYRVGANDEVVKILIIVMRSKRADKHKRTSWHNETKSLYTWKTHPGLDRISALMQNETGGTIDCPPTTCLSLMQLFMPHGEWHVLQCAPLPDPFLYVEDVEVIEPTDQQSDSEQHLEPRSFQDKIQYQLKPYLASHSAHSQVDG